MHEPKAARLPVHSQCELLRPRGHQVEDPGRLVELGEQLGRRGLRNHIRVRVAHADKQVIGSGGVALRPFHVLYRADRRKEKSLLEHGFRQTLENVAMVAIVIDRQGRVTFANDYLLELTGWSREEVLGRDSFSIFVPADDAETIRQIFEEAMADGEFPAHYENEIVTRDGERRLIASSNIVQVDEHGKPEGVISIGEDITERRRADEVLRNREEFLTSVIENVSDVITIFSADGKSVFESPSVERVLGWTPEELVGGPRFLLLHPDDVELVHETFVAIFAGETRGPMEIRLRHRDGSWRTVESVGRRLHHEGEDVIVVNYHDVTEQLQLREQLLQAQKLEAVGRLAGGVAHDFNNILTAIVGYSEFLAGSFADDDPRREEALEIVSAAGRAAALTGQLLAFSRQEVVQTEVLDLGEVVAAVESMLTQLLGGDVTLATTVEPGCWVSADRGQLERVIANLAVNASDAMPAGGRLELSVSRQGEEVELAVRDSGIGMDAETLSHIFEPFFTTKDVGKGTGLGLATAYGIVTQAGGRLSVVSEPGEGACFRAAFPLRAAVTEPEEAVEVLAGTETILLAEDEETIRRLVTDVLKRQGYTVLAAASGAEALELLATHGKSVDLLFTDILMPGMTGTDLYRAASALNPSLRVLFTSGYTNEPHEIFDEPRAAFIGKPFTAHALVTKVREVLDAKPP